MPSSAGVQWKFGPELRWHSDPGAGFELLHRSSPRLIKSDLAGRRCGHGGATWPWGRGVPRGAAALLLDRVRVTIGQGAAAAGVALRLEEDAAGRRGCVAGGREAGAGGGVAEGAAAAKYWPVREITNTHQISAITSTGLVRNEVDDRATTSQKSSLPQVTRFVSRALPPDTWMTTECS